MSLIFKNYVYNLSYKIITIIIPFITIPYISRILGPEGIGLYSYTFANTNYFIILGSLGSIAYGSREIAYYQQSLEQRSKVFTEVFIFKIITGLIAYITFLIFIFWFFDGNNKIFYLVHSFTFFANILDISWLYTGVENFKNIFYRSLIIKIFSLIAIFTFIKESDDLINYFIILGLSNLIGNIFLYINLKKYVSFTKVRFINVLKRFIPILKFFIPFISIMIFANIDKTMLGIINGEFEVGIYENSKKVVNLLYPIITSLGVVFLPRLANDFKNGSINKTLENTNRLLKISNLIAVPISFGLMAISNEFVLIFFGDEFIGSIAVLNILSFFLILTSWNTTLGGQFLISINKENYFTLATVSGAISNVIFNYIFIPKFGAQGAAFGSIIAEIILLFVILIIVTRKKYFNLKDLFDFEVIKYLISGFLMYFILIFVDIDDLIINLLIKILLGIILYPIFLFLLKSSYLSLILKRLKK